MRIVTRMCTSAVGYVTTPDGWPAQIADPAWDPAAFGFIELQARCDAVVMGRTTFLPALAVSQWPWQQPVLPDTSELQRPGAGALSSPKNSPRSANSPAG